MSVPDAFTIASTFWVAGASARFAHELGADATLALVEAAYETAVTTGPRSRVRDALGGQLVLLSDPRATANRPLLTAWHGLALLDQGDNDGAALSLARAVDAAGDRGEACVVARGGLALVAIARGADVADPLDRMRSCAPHPLIGEAWIREFGFGALLGTTTPEAAVRVR